MNMDIWLADVKHLIHSKRTSYTILIMCVFAIAMALVVKAAPPGLAEALRSAAPGSAGVFEYMWFENVLNKFLLLIFISYGAFIICDLEDDRSIAMIVTKPVTRTNFILRRTASSLSGFFFVYFVGIALSGAIAAVIVGNLDYPLFMLHHVQILPMFLFTYALTFFLSVPLRNTTPSVLTAFSITLAASFLYTFTTMADPTAVPSGYNPLTLGYLILIDSPLTEPMIISLAYAAGLYSAGLLWFNKKDI